jgi:hypothetical protein
MRLRFTRRRVVVATTAMTLALGSAAAHALLPTLPDPLQSTADKLVAGADNIVGHIVAPRPPGEPEPETGANIPGTGSLPLVSDLLAPQPKAAAAAKPKAAAAKKPAPSEEGPVEAVTGILAEVTGSPEREPAVPPPFPQEDTSLDSLTNEPLIAIGESSYGHGWNVCNNNNQKTIVNEESNSDNEVEQENSGGDVVTNVDGHSGPSGDDPDTDCE